MYHTNITLTVEEHEYMYGLPISSLVSQSVNLFLKHNDLCRKRKGSSRGEMKSCAS